jgi:putative transposase
VEYIHFNPVKHGHVSRAADWPYSSIHRYIKAGMIADDWGGGICDNDRRGYGERE